jgi:hypothetical protein
MDWRAVYQDALPTLRNDSTSAITGHRLLLKHQANAVGAIRPSPRPSSASGYRGLSS